MRILHVDSARTWRGGQNQVLLTAQGMKLRGHDVAIAAFRGGMLETRASEAGIETCSIAFHGDLSPAAVLARTRIALAAARHCPCARRARTQRGSRCRPDGARGISGGIASRRFFSSRSFLALQIPAGEEDHRRKPGDRFQSWKKTGFPRTRARRARGSPGPRTEGRGSGLLRSLGVPDNSQIVGNIAALTDHKDHLTLIESARIVLARRGDVRFVIAGEGECRPALEQRLRETGLEDKVLLLGFRGDIDLLLPEFTLFCLSSHMEGLGTSLLDAMAFGLPIVATKSRGDTGSGGGRRYRPRRAAARPVPVGRSAARASGRSGTPHRDGKSGARFCSNSVSLRTGWSKTR